MYAQRLCQGTSTTRADIVGPEDSDYSRNSIDSTFKRSPCVRWRH